MWDSLLEAIKEKCPIVLFGCTELGTKICADIRLISADIQLFFYDNDVAKQQKNYCDVFVMSLEELKEKISYAYFILTSPSAFLEMQQQLMGLGASEDHIILPEAILKRQITLLENKADAYERIIEKRTPKKELGFVVDLAEHCNLNCQSCDHFSPLAKPFFTDIMEFKNDLKRMYELFGKAITSIGLEGGEPLLNPRVEKFIYIVYEIFPFSQIQIFTNGILLPKMGDSFWEACRSCGVVLEVTKYPIAFDYDEAEKKAEQRGIRLRYYSGGDEVKTSMYKPLDVEGKQDKYENYHRCWNANSDCIMLKKGKLYTCTRIPNLETFNRFYDRHLEVTDRDYIDIYRNVTAEEIFEFLSNPMPACRYCRIQDWSGGHKWGISKKAITEWI